MPHNPLASPDQEELRTAKAVLYVLGDQEKVIDEIAASLISLGWPTKQPGLARILNNLRRAGVLTKLDGAYKLTDAGKEHIEF